MKENGRLCEALISHMAFVLKQKSTSLSIPTDQYKKGLNQKESTNIIT